MRRCIGTWAARLSYSDYLRLDLLLNAQQPLSTEHDEMLFIIVHQVSELWMRLMLHELHAAIECVRRDDLDPSFKMLDAHRSRAQTQLLAVWEVLSTMTPADYSSFRNLLGRSSGFQSVQYRHARVHARQQARRMYRGASATTPRRTRCWRGRWQRPVCMTRYYGCCPSVVMGAGDVAGA